MSASNATSNSVQGRARDDTDAAFITLKTDTATGWVEAVTEDFNAFLIDHAACERKAAAVATSMICHYPDRRQLVADMADLAAEEMSHFRQVIKLIHARGVQLTADTKDPYVNALRQHVRHGKDEYLLDRLLIAGVVEARGTERFGLLATHLDDMTLKQFYRQLAVSESRHQQLFLELALRYLPRDVVLARLTELEVIEADIVDRLPFRAALH